MWAIHEHHLDVSRTKKQVISNFMVKALVVKVISKKLVLYGHSTSSESDVPLILDRHL